MSLWTLGMAGDIVRAMDVAIGKPQRYPIVADGLGSGELQDITRSEDIVWMKTSKCDSSYEVSYMPTARLSHIETHSIIISLGKYVPYQCKVCPCQQQPAP